MHSKEINKAIPGGKYGCALMVKNCGPAQLQSLSLGKIISLVSKALKNEVLIHLKTFIVKNNNFPIKKSKEVLRAIQEMKDMIFVVIQEKPEKSVTLAQLPSLLLNKFGKCYDLSELGYPKLKNFLMTMDNLLELEEY